MLRIRLSGQLGVEIDGRAVQPPIRQDVRRVWAYLALHPGADLTRGEVAFALWPDARETQARAALRRALHRINEYLTGIGAPPGLLRQDRRFLRWEPGTAATVDATVFAAECGACDGLPPDAPPQQAIGCLEGALARFPDDLLSDLADDWVVEARQRLATRRADALRRLVDLYERVGEIPRALAVARRLLAQDDLSEIAHRRLMRLHALSGNRAEALRQFDTCQQRLREALGADPLPETLRLRQLIAEGRSIEEVSHFAPAAWPEAVGAGLRPGEATPTGRVGNLPLSRDRFVGRASGIRELRALLRATPLVTLVAPGGMGKTRLAIETARAAAGEFEDGAWLIDLSALSDPALVPVAAATALGIYCPPDVSPRAALVAHLAARQTLLVIDNCEHLLDAAADLAGEMLAACPRVRILATSRERLRLAQERDWLVPPLEVPDDDAIPDHEYLRGHEAVELFLDRAQRARFQFAPSARELPAIASICRRLDGMPLAIELAAARIRILSVTEIAERLDRQTGILGEGPRSSPERQRTIRATIDWSWDLLDEAERSLFRRLAVFADGFTLEAIERVCADPAPQVSGASLLDPLAGLVEKSLVDTRASDEAGYRYRLLGVIREYGLTQLDRAGERAALARRHAAYFLQVAEEAAQHLQGPGQDRWIARLAVERRNLEEAMVFLGQAKGGGRESALRLGGALWRYWYMRGDLDWERRWLESCLGAVGEPAPSHVEATARHAAGALAFAQGDMTAAHGHYQAAVALRRDLAEEAELARSLDHLAVVCTALDDLDGAAAAARESLVLKERSGDRQGVVDSLNVIANIEITAGRYEEANALLVRSLALDHDVAGAGAESLMTLRHLGVVAQRQGRFADARRWLEQGLASAAAHARRRDQAIFQNELGLVAAWIGAHDEAHALLRQSLEGHRELGDPLAIAQALCNLSSLALARRDAATARMLAREARALATEHGGEADRLFAAGCLIEAMLSAEDTAGTEALAAEIADLAPRAVDPDLRAWCLRVLGEIALTEGRLATSARYLTAVLDTQARVGLRAEVARSLDAGATLAAARGDGALAARLIGAGTALRDAIGAPRSPLDTERLNDTLAATRALLGDDTLERALAAGGALPLADAVALALAGLTPESAAPEPDRAKP